MQKRYQWTKNFANGDRYNGEAVGENVKDGVGEYYWAATGATYKGSWANDLPHGEGVMTVPAVVDNGGAALAMSHGGGDCGGYTYEGRFERGQRSGAGTCRFTSGRVYVGEWRMDEMWGQGTLTGAPGGLDSFVEYTGPFLRGRRHGPGGRCRYTNGDVYVGEWLQGVRHGEGEWRLSTSAAATTAPLPVAAPAAAPSDPHELCPVAAPSPRPAVVLYRGAFHQDVPACASGGVVEYADGSSYTGGVAGLQVHREGTGEHRMAGGDVYVGGFHEDLRSGRGTLRRAADGAVFEADWRADRLDGHVSFRRPRPTSGGPPTTTTTTTTATNTAGLAVLTYSGPARLGELSGPGARVTYAEGSVYVGEVRRCQPEGSGVLEGRPLRSADGAAPAWLAPGAAALLVRYEGAFLHGRPEGEGVGSVRVTALAAEGGAGVGAADVRPPGVLGLRLPVSCGGSFAGSWRAGLPDGRGRWSWEDGGGAYEGAVGAGGAPSGEGTFRSAQATYTGAFASGQPHGRGTYRHLLTGETYEGEWAHGLFSGEGTYERPERVGGGGQAAVAVAYTGGWLAGRMSGCGLERRAQAAATLETDPVFANAPTHYDGELREGRYEGRGTLAVAAAVGGEPMLPRYEGSFTAGVRTGAGLLTFADGATIEGTFVEGRPHGERLTARMVNGTTYTGPYHEGVPTGVGDIAYPNGDRYRGEVEPASATSPAPSWQPQRHGKGTFTFAEGNALACTWRHNVLHGEGTYTTVTGDISTRQYVEGVVTSTARLSGAAEADIFTAENELPNTLSEGALRRAQGQEGRKPFAFIRKGEGGGGGTATAGARAADTSVSPRRSVTHHATGTAAPATAASKRSNSTSLASGSSPATDAAAPPVRRREAETSPQSSHRTVAAPDTSSGGGGGARRRSSRTGTSLSTSPQRAEAAVVAVVAESRRVHGGGGGISGGSAGPHAGGSGGPVRSRAQVQAAVARRMSSRAPVVTAESMTVEVAGKRASLLEAFQEGVGRLDTQPLGATDTPSAASSGRASPGVVAGAAAGSRSWTPPRGPLTGPLRNLMEEASAIRSSREDEIHLLTEEVRVLNEKIWQLRFSIRADTGATSARGRSAHAAQLAAMIRERKGAVEKLNLVLETEEL